MAKALIAMSGGVDSSVAAYMCREQGYDCIGCTMKLHDDPVTADGSCGSSDDAEDARSVAAGLGMEHYVFDFSGDFKKEIIDKFIASYLKGETPNPCIECNRCMKFGKLYKQAEELGCQFVVTGHYARIEEKNGKFYLKKGLDEGKDQSYVLYSLTQEQLAHTLFPLGELSKNETRKIAEENGFINAAKPDSQDICFVPDGDYARVIEENTGVKPEPGDFVDIDGNVIGKHLGIIHYTVGQRKGLGMTFGEPRYVCGIDAENNTVTLGSNADLFRKEVLIDSINWISGEAPSEPFRCEAKIRYNQKAQPAEVYPDGAGAKIVFDEPQRAVTPGQSAVMYDGDTVIGGGKIIK